jgi:hypothetical protein
MVSYRELILFLFILMVPIFLPADSEKISVVSEVDSSESFANEPIKGTISITHNRNEQIDNNSFVLDQQPLSAELVKEVQISPDNPLILSIYSFKLPPQPQGLYALPQVSVRVGKSSYQSTMSSYTVGVRKSPRNATPLPASSQPVKQSPSSPQTANTGASPSLRLEATINGKKSLYPGQHTTLVYRYYFTGDIALTTETLPLLDAQGFIKIGEKEIQDSVQGTVSVREISQQIEAISPGTYKLGPSVIEGYAYKENTPGHPVYTSDKLSAEAPPVVITVEPFPKDNQPASFNGAVGRYTFAAKLLSPAAVTEGDELSLSLKVSGTGNLKNIKAPDLCCQPGFSGFFRTNDLPPAEEVNDNTKTFLVKLKPLNPLIQAIPGIEFSFFDPEKGQYETLHSEPIPLQVKALSTQQKAEQQNKTPETTQKQELSPPTPKPIEIESIFPLSTPDLYNKRFGTWWALAIIPFGLALLIYLHHLHVYLEWKKTQIPPVTSKQLFAEAFAEMDQGKCNFELLERSFKLALFERGLLSSLDADWPEEGIGKEVGIFWSFLEEKRFGGKSDYSLEEIHQVSQGLMNKISQIPPTESIKP